MSSTGFSNDSPSDHTNYGDENSPLAKGAKLQKEEIKILEADLDQTTVMTHIRSKIKNLESNKTLKMHEWVGKKKVKENKILEKAGVKQGSTNMIKWYQNTMDKVMKMLIEEEKKDAEPYAEEFAKEMWKCCGARVVVMVAWKDNDGEVMVPGQVCHDFNDELGNGKCFPELEHCWQKHMVRKSKARPQILLPTHQNGTPYISNILDLCVPEMKDIMRAFVTFHYRKACGKPTATVPCGAIASNPSTYIAPKYLPHGVTFKEPTHLTQDELTQILELLETSDSSGDQEDNRGERSSTPNQQIPNAS
ncbi:hypothetical protein V8B97DRAFT_2021039 [Scleroderma yunnanense]